MIQETGQDGGLQTCTPYKRPSLIQALFGRMSTEVDVGVFLGCKKIDYPAAFIYHFQGKTIYFRKMS